MKRVLTLVIGLAMVSSFAWSTTTDCSAVSNLSQLLSGGIYSGCTVGDKLFDNFTLSSKQSISGTGSVTADTTGTEVGVNGTVGAYETLDLFPDWSATSGATGKATLVITIGFSVTASSPYYIVGADGAMTSTGSSSGTGLSAASFNSYICLVTPCSTTTTPHQTFGESSVGGAPATPAHPSVDFYAAGGLGAHTTVDVTEVFTYVANSGASGMATASLSAMEFGFEQSPEPATFALAGFALIGLGLLGRRRKFNR